MSFTKITLYVTQLTKRKLFPLKSQLISMVLSTATGDNLPYFVCRKRADKTARNISPPSVLTMVTSVFKWSLPTS